MKKRRIISACILCLLLLMSTAGCGVSKEESSPGYISPQFCGSLQVQNGKLCDQEGTPIQLKGVSTHAVTRTEPFLNEDLIREMREDWGVNVLRLSMYVLAQDGYTKSEYYRDKNIELVKKGIELATANDLYALVDWHVLEDQNPLTYQNEALEFFDLIADEYADSPNVLYEICNEPNNTEWSDIKSYADAVIPVIRSHNPDAVIICGTPAWSQGVDQALADPLDYENVMYTLHYYSATHKDELRDRMISCAEAGLPIFVTEYGVCASSGGFPRDLEEADRWMDALDQYGISSCIWCLAKNGEACCLLSPQTTKTSEITEEDFNETGTWFYQMMQNYKENITNKK